jgi:hypothetical protein
MKGGIGGCHTEPHEDINFNGGRVGGAESKNGHHNARVQACLLPAKSVSNGLG